MCNRVATPKEDEIKGYFDKMDTKMSDLFKVDQYEPFYHITSFTRPMIPFVTNADPLHIGTAMWKFLPEKASLESYAKYDTCNAKAEEIFEKPTYRDYILNKRGLVVLKGFYEGQEQPDKTSQPFFIYPKDGGILTLACVYSDWYDRDAQQPKRTFSILTVDANPMMAEIHNKKKRMPLVVTPEQREWWLGDRTKEELKAFFVPTHEGYLAAHKVTRGLYKRGYDTNTPEIQKEVA